MKPAQPSARPRVCVVVLNHNGGSMTLKCLEALLATDWPTDRLGVVLVDNASNDGVAQRVLTELPTVGVIESSLNRGFAGGNNLALRELGDADYVALVNNDAVVTPGWLAPLVETIEASADVGAACPKILFQPRFLELTIQSPTHQRGGDRRLLGVRISGARLESRNLWSTAQLVRGFWGPEYGRPPEPEFQWTSREATLRLPVPSGADVIGNYELRLATDVATNVKVESADRSTELTVGTTPAWHQVQLGGSPIDVINNVGNVLQSGRFGSDRGYLEPDDGRFDHPADVFAWCGAAVLLRTEYLRDIGLFDERLFLYSEDLDLSWRGHSRGWIYRYDPRSVVRHEHSATTGENSRTAAYYSARNRLLVLTRHAPARQVARSVLHDLLVTASYARRDLAQPILHGRPANAEAVRRRLHAFAGYVRLAPSMLMTRWRDRNAAGPERRDAQPRKSAAPG